MFFEGKLQFRYEVDGTVYQGGTEGTDHYAVQIVKADDDRFILDLIPKCKIKPLFCGYEIPFTFTDKSRAFPNGYQAWTRTEEYSRDDILEGAYGLGKHGLVKRYCQISSDQHFRKYSEKPGELQGFTYSYTRDGEDVDLMASLSERQGYTIFNFYMRENRIVIEKDLEGIVISEQYRLYDLFHAAGDMDSVFDAYAAALEIPKTLRKEPLSGYTSWYNYFGNISEEILLRDLNGLMRAKGTVNIFQIDDGYQTATGDWLTVKEDLFPHGMRYISDKIHAEGLLAGIWIAPFAAAKFSRVAKEHPDWLIRNKRGNKELGVSLAWKYGAYTLDMYNPEARAYIKHFFDVILHEWNFDMVKLDFLYAQCITPRLNKTRGQIMCEAIDFLRECVGDKLFLGCGVPLGPTFGKVDACRISCDVDLSFKEKWYVYQTGREVPSTVSAMNNSIFRRQLNGRIFLNDTDVFHLRNTNLKFTDKQKHLLATVNNLCGSVLFVSDNAGDYSEETLEAAKKYFTPTTKKVLSAEFLDKGKTTIAIVYDDNGEKYKLTFNTRSGENKTEKL